VDDVDSSLVFGDCSSCEGGGCRLVTVLNFHKNSKIYPFVRNR
jgi:hypothetical protein